MPQEAEGMSNLSRAMLASPCKNFRGVKTLMPSAAAASNEAYGSNNNNQCSASPGDDFFHDDELALRRAGEAAARRSLAAEWLRRMDRVAWEILPRNPSDEAFCVALRNGLILCNVLNKIKPGAVPKVVDNPDLAMQYADGAAHSAIQYFENTRNFLVAVGNMKLLTFEASDLEKGGSSSNVVDCILCLKGYYEWMQSGGVGVWRYGGTVKIVSFPKESRSSSSVSSESAEDSLIDEFDSSQCEQLSEFLQLSDKVSIEESTAAKALRLLFDRVAIRTLQAYLTEKNGIGVSPMNPMVVDGVIRKVVKNFSSNLVSQGIQLGNLMKKILNSDTSLSNKDFLHVILQYLSEQTTLISSDLSYICICGGEKVTTESVLGNASNYAEVIANQQKQIEELKMFFQNIRLEATKIKFQWQEEVTDLRNHISSLEVTSSSYHKVLEENRFLYNQVQDLKGTIRVYCRVRPFLAGQSDKGSTVDYIGEDGNIMIVHPNKQGRDARKVFSFNKVFGTNVTQQQIYADTQPLVRSVLDGFNVCIFAYGQTGSGKTYTMSGPDLTMENTWGVNYRALQDLFQISKSREDAIEYQIGVQMIEIYNEQVRDLLVIDGSTRRLEIRNNSQLNGLNVPDASLIPVNGTQDVLDLMKIGQKNRAVGATALNERSSRSHSILTIHVQGKDLLSGTILRGCLHLVDLAGSERVDKSEAVGERLREAQHINKSLSALGDVIAALAQKSAHIPYRNSKLTQVLQDSLGGQAKTLMFVHINPEAIAIGETLSTLKFAERVATIDLGAAKSNKETAELRDLKEEISNLKSAFEKKEAEYEHLKSSSSITRCNSEALKTRAISPLPIPKFVDSSNSKQESDLRSVYEARSCSSVKQRRPRVLANPGVEKDVVSARVLPVEESSSKKGSRSKLRSPSPPVRRSISTDRGSLFRSRLKPDIVTDEPVRRLQFPTKASVNKSVVATVPAISAATDRAASKETTFDVLQSLNIHRSSSKKFPSDNEDDHPNQVVNTKQFSARKAKPESKTRTRQQPPPAKTHRSNSTERSFSGNESGNIDESTRCILSSEPENDSDLLVGSPAILSSTDLRRSSRNPSRVSQNVEPTSGLPMRTVESILAAGKLESSRLPIPRQHPNEGTKISAAADQLRRSRSTPRGKFLL